MKKIFTVLIALLVFATGTMAVSAADGSGIWVETPVEMTFVSESEGNYEYNVSVNVSITENDFAATDKSISILMFGNRDNTAFVSGNNVLNLTAEEIARDYYVYYVDQSISDGEGKVVFDFTVDLPSPAKTDAYYVWVGAENTGDANKLSTGDLGVTSQIVAVTLAADSNEVIMGESIALTPNAVNLFGNTVPGVEYSYSVSQNGGITEAEIYENILSTYGLAGIYSIMVTATATDGTTVTSDGLNLSVDGATLLGDPDGNKRINLHDAITVLKHIMGILTMEDGAVNAGDINRNGNIELQDACNILKYIARMIKHF